MNGKPYIIILSHGETTFYVQAAEPPTVPYCKARYRKTVIKYPHIVLKVKGVVASNNKTNPTAADVDRTGLGCVLESVDVDVHEWITGREIALWHQSTGERPLMASFN